MLQAKGVRALKTPYTCSPRGGDGKQLIAAMALGARGVNCGTRFCATKESNYSESLTQRMVQANQTDAVLMFRTLRNTSRVIKDVVAKGVDKIQIEKGKDLQLKDVENLVAGTSGRAAEKAGDLAGGIWSTGQTIVLIDNYPSVQELMGQFMAEAEGTVDLVRAPQL